MCDRVAFDAWREFDIQGREFWDGCPACDLARGRYGMGLLFVSGGGILFFRKGWIKYGMWKEGSKIPVLLFVMNNTGRQFTGP